MARSALLVAGLLAGCAASVAPDHPPAIAGDVVPPAVVQVVSEKGLIGGEGGTQRLFRVRYRGPEGSGGLRLVLRLAAADRFQLAASDTLGRPVWGLGFVGGQTRIVDHRVRETCLTGSDVRVPEIALASLPVELLPVVLLGRLPVAAGETDGEVDVLDRRERRWTAKMEKGRPLSWTLWSGGEPSLWWLAQPEGGVLSHRAGSQFRWRQTVVEPLTVGLEALASPSEYPEVDCDEWGLPQLRQDQSAPAGDRPSR